MSQIALDREAHGHDSDTRRGGAAHFAVLFHDKLSLWLSLFLLPKSEGGFVNDGQPSQLHQDPGRRTVTFCNKQGSAIQKRNTKTIVLKQTMHLSAGWALGGL